MTPIQKSAPICYRARNQPKCDQGFEAAQAGKPLTQIDIDAPFDPVSRSAWLAGWEAGGGIPSRGIVVTQRMRWEEERAQILERLTWLNAQLELTP